MFKRNEKKNGKGTLTPKMPFAARFSCCAMVVLTSPVKCLFRTLQVCTLWLVALFQQGAHHLTLSPLFVFFWDMMKCIFLHRFLLLYSLSCVQASREQVSLILVAVEVGPPVVSGVLLLMTSMSYCALPFDETSKFSHSLMKRFVVGVWLLELAYILLVACIAKYFQLSNC